MEMVFRWKQMILKAAAIVDAYLGFRMDCYDVERQQYLSAGENQPFVTQQQSNGCHRPVVNPCVSFPVVNQWAQSRQANCCRPNFGFEPHNSRQIAPQSDIPYTCSRRVNDSSNSLQWRFCWVVINLGLTCATVFGLLFLLRYLDSPLLRSDVHSASSTGAIFLENSAQKECRPCLGSEQIDDRSSKIRNCCAVDRDVLKKFIEKITEETLSTRLSETHQSQKDISREKSKAGQSSCGALFFLYPDKNNYSTQANQPGGYSVLRGWSDDGNVAYKHPCITYTNSTGEVTISQSGFYVVYSHLGFTWDSKTQSTMLGHEIRFERMDKQIKEPIAKDTRAIQPNNFGSASIPSYNSRTMATVHLVNGTKLTVHARPAALVMRGNFISSFGLFRLRAE